MTIDSTMTQIVGNPSTTVHASWTGNISKPSTQAINDIKPSLLDSLILIFDFYIPCVVLSFGFLGNAITCVTMTQRMRARKNIVMSYHFRALAIGDTLILALGDAQRLILSRIPNAFESNGNFICKEYNYLIFTLFGISVWNVVIVSIDRLIAVWFPFKAAVWCTLKKARTFYAFSVCFHVLFNIVKLWKYYEKDETNVHTETCVNPAEFPAWFEEFILMFYYVIVNYSAPVIVLILNVCILVKFRRQGKELEQMVESGARKRQDDQERNLTFLMLVVAFAFIILVAYYPLEDIVWTYLIPHVATKYPKIRELSFYISYYSTTLNECINFYIYFILSASFRKDVFQLLHIDKYWKS
jgi:growth hormone secretagogue receptor